MRALLGMRQTWGCVLARVATDPITYFISFWIPKYLDQQHGLSMARIGAVAWIPFAGISIGNILGGAVSAGLVRAGWSFNKARKTTMVFSSDVHL